MACRFCSQGDGGLFIVKETPAVVVALANPRLVPGHLVIFPKEHVARLGELAWEPRSELMETVVEFQEKIMDRLSSGCDIRYGALPTLPAHNKGLEHIHIHLYPREVNDELFCRSQVFELALLLPPSIDEQVTIPRLLKDLK